ncbi:hypothetical protein EDD68_11039 [Melghiribacillus thermohalophilus]|uniref:Nucleotidyltransferase-like protein n=1 Tax=Melghiribacillus thermohalophilus TaxID=1324956 RepID=A0A4R3MZ71_9BACI|nr:nucleotidyltransferase family protein [Melghiribacillus thermohalophilus]TCT21735.1 hypothetical protein EDD68_11039 [Melghiribacillus thermohalophilus]
MKLRDEKDIIQLFHHDEWIIDILKAVKSMNLPDWWICAGFIRSKIWDNLHGFKERTPVRDIDVIFFDEQHVSESEEKKIEKELDKIWPGLPWSVKNQARMHKINKIPPYESALDGISKFPETVTALGIKLDKSNEIQLAAPWGVKDVINMEVRPTPYFKASKKLMDIYQKRITEKQWSDIWPKVTVYDD